MKQYWASELSKYRECDGMKRLPSGNLDPVHQHSADETWWWYDETWADELGPFLTREEAQQSCERYAREVLR